MANTDISSLDCEPIAPQRLAKLKVKIEQTSILRNWTQLLGLILTFITLAAFSISIFRWYSAPGNQVHEWDENEYYYNATSFYKSPNIRSMLGTNRPNFMWAPSLILKCFQIPLTPDRISLLTAFLSWAIIVYSVFYISKLLNTSRLVFLFSITLFFSLPLTLEFSKYILGDLFVVALFAALTAASLGLVKSKNYGNDHLLIFFGVAVFSLLTKPVFLMPVFSVTGLVAIFSFFETSLKSKDRIRVIVLLLSTIVVSLLVAYRFRSFISDLYFNNETLAIWAQSGIIANILWYPKVFLENLCLGHILGLFGFLSLFFLTLKKNTNFKCIKPILFIVVPWAMMVVYLSLIVVSKYLRGFLFLFVFPAVFFPLLLDKTLDQFSKRVSIFILIFISMNASIALWNACFNKRDFIPSQVVSFSDRTLMIPEIVTTPTTFEDAKISEITDFILADCLNNKGKCSLSTLLVFLPHSGLINPSTFSSFPLLVKNASNTQGELIPALSVEASLYRYGAWYQPGGIPRSFLNSDYIVYYSQVPCCRNSLDIEIYNRIILQKFIERDNTFLDGLIQVAEFKSNLGPVHILRREKLPSTTNFLKIVETFQFLDPDNWWNHPFLDAADKIRDKHSTKFLPNLERLKGKESVPAYTKAWNFPPPGDYSYPGFLKRVN